MNKPKPYSEEFKTAVKAEFPTLPYNLQEHLEAGSDFVGRFLDDNQGRLDVQEIACLAKQGDAPAILALCEKIERRRSLYSQWCDLRRPQY